MTQAAFNCWWEMPIHYVRYFARTSPVDYFERAVLLAMHLIFWKVEHYITCFIRIWWYDDWISYSLTDSDSIKHIKSTQPLLSPYLLQKHFHKSKCVTIITILAVKFLITNKLRKKPYPLPRVDFFSFIWSLYAHFPLENRKTIFQNAFHIYTTS